MTHASIGNTSLSTLFRIVGLTTATALAGTPALAEDTRPDVLMMVWDTTRMDHLSLYGHTRPTTPNLDRIAQDAVVFTDAQTSGYWTVPAAASLLTGLFPHNHGVDFEPYRTPDYSIELPSEAVTLAEMFNAAGYRTGMLNASRIITDNPSFAQGFEVFEFIGEGRLAQRALEYVQEDDDRPWLLVMWYLTPHAPYTPEAPWDRWVRDDVGPVNIRGCNKSVEAPEGHVNQCDVNSGKVVLDADQWDQLERMYDGEILRNDHHLGAFWTKLEQGGHTDNLVFAFTSDHGEAFNDHDNARAWHNFPYDNNQSVPLVLRYPDKLPAARVDTAVRTMDLYATLAELAQITPPTVVNAQSLLPVARGTDTTDRPNTGGNHGGMRYYYDGQHKLVYVRRSPTTPDRLGWLFDQHTDPREANNLAKAQPALGEKVHQAAKRFIEQTSIEVGQGSGIDDAQVQLLREMGYLE